MQPSGPRREGWGRKQGKHLSRAHKTLGVDLKRNLLTCRNASYNASVEQLGRLGRWKHARVCPSVSKRPVMASEHHLLESVQPTCKVKTVLSGVLTTAKNNPSGLPRRLCRSRRGQV